MMCRCALLLSLALLGLSVAPATGCGGPPRSDAPRPAPAAPPAGSGAAATPETATTPSAPPAGQLPIGRSPTGRSPAAASPQWQLRATLAPATTGGARRLTLLLVDRRQTTTPQRIASAAGVWLSGPEGERLLPFVDLEEEPDAVRLRCAPDPDHRVELSLHSAPGSPTALDLELRDRVPYRATIRELRLDLQLHGPLSTPSRRFEPLHVTATPRTTTAAPQPDRGFRVPLLWVASSDLALALEPDVTRLDQDRRLPWQAGLGPAADGTLQLRCGLTAGDGAMVRDDELCFAGHLQLQLGPGADSAERFHEQIDAIWERHCRSGLRRAPLPLHQPPHDSIGFAALRARNATDAHPAASGQIETPRGKVVAPLELRGPDQELRFTPDSPLADALLAARRAELASVAAPSDPAPADAWRGDLAQLAALLGRVPARHGLLHASWRRELATGVELWQIGSDGDDLADRFRAGPSAWLLGLALEARAERPDDTLPRPIDAALQRRAGALAGFLTRAQRSDGRLPARYAAPDLTPEGSASPGELALQAWFLAVAADLLPRGPDDSLPAAVPTAQELREAAVRALQLVRRAVDQGAPLQRTTTARTETLPLVAAVRCTCRLLRHTPTLADDALRDTRATALRDTWATALRETLATLCIALVAQQQSFQASWRRDAPLGGFATDDGALRLDARSSALAALALGEAAEVRADTRLAERAGCALRAALLLDAGPAALAVLEDLRRRLGDVLLDPDSGTAASLTDVWIEHFTLGSGAGGDRLRLVSHDADRRTEPAAVTIVALPARGAGGPRRVLAEAWPENAELRLANRPLPEGRSPEGAGPEASRSRLVHATVPVWVAPQLRPVLPPHLPPAPVEWQPTLACAGLAAPDTSFEIRMTLPDGEVLRSPLVRDGAGDLRPPRPLLLPLSQVPVGAELEVAVFEQAGPRRITHPPDGPLRLRVATSQRIDLGAEPAPAELVDADTLATAPFVDGRRRAREIPPQGHLDLQLPVDPGAFAVDLSARVSGRLTVAILGEDEVRTIHETRDVGTALPNRLTLHLADRRLWRDGSLRLRLANIGGDRAQIAELDLDLQPGTLSADHVASPGHGLQPDAAPSALPDRLRVTVIPVEVEGGPRADVEGLRLAWFGGSGYRSTPAPRARLTAGSVRHWLHGMSGGLLRVFGQVTAPRRVRAELAAQIDPEQLLPAVLAELDGLVAGQGPPPDVVVLTWYGPVPTTPLTAATPPMRPATSDAPRVLLLPATPQDGEPLALRDLATALLGTHLALRDLGDAQHGNLGALAMSSSPDPHLPAAPAAGNLAATGWVDVWSGAGDVDREIVLGETLRARDAVRLTVPDRLGGDLWFEVHGRRGGTDDSGLLLLRRFAADRAPWVRAQDGALQRIHTLRLATDQVSAVGTRRPGRHRELLRRTDVLNDRSLPNLFPLGFTLPFQLEDLQVEDGLLTVRVHALVDDLLDSTETSSDARFHTVRLRRRHPERRERLAATLRIPPRVRAGECTVLAGTEAVARVALPVDAAWRTLQFEIDLPRDAGLGDPTAGTVTLRHERDGSDADPLPEWTMARCAPRSDPRDEPNFPNLVRAATQLDAAATRIVSAWSIPADSTPLSGLVLLPSGSSALALAVAAAPPTTSSGPGSAAAAAVLTVRLRELDGAPATTLVEDFSVPVATPHLQHLLLELPPSWEERSSLEERSALIELTVTGGDLCLVDARVAR